MKINEKGNDNDKKFISDYLIVDFKELLLIKLLNISLNFKFMSLTPLFFSKKGI